MRKETQENPEQNKSTLENCHFCSHWQTLTLARTTDFNDFKAVTHWHKVYTGIVGISAASLKEKKKKVGDLSDRCKTKYKMY